MEESVKLRFSKTWCQELIHKVVKTTMFLVTYTCLTGNKYIKDQK